MEKSSEAVTECMGCVRYAYTLTGDGSEKGECECEERMKYKGLKK